MRDATYDAVKPGVKLSLTSQPIYSTSDAGGRDYVREVGKVRTSTDYRGDRVVVIYFKGSKVPFRAAGRDEVLAIWSAKRKYIVNGIVEGALQVSAMDEARVLPSENRGFGFYGTLKGEGLSPLQVDAGWKAASEWIMANIPRITSELARELLDSAWGRHRVDALYDEMGGFPNIVPSALGKAIKDGLDRLKRKQPKTFSEKRVSTHLVGGREWYLAGPGRSMPELQKRTAAHLTKMRARWGAEGEESVSDHIHITLTEGLGIGYRSSLTSAGFEVIGDTFGGGDIYKSPDGSKFSMVGNRFMQISTKKTPDFERGVRALERSGYNVKIVGTGYRRKAIVEATLPPGVTFHRITVPGADVESWGVRLDGERIGRVEKVAEGYKASFHGAPAPIRGRVFDTKEEAAVALARDWR